MRARPISVPQLASACLVLLVGCAEPAPQAAPRHNVLLISLDTLRRDHVGSYDPARSTTPFLDAFAADSLRFEQAFSHHPWTLTAHATMLSGLLPAVHGLLSDRRLRDEVQLLPESFAAAGFATLGLVDQCEWLDPKFGFEQGFGSYTVMDTNASNKVDALLTKLDSLGDTPFFAFAHFFDAHSDFTQLPYESDPRFREEYAGWYEGDFDGRLAAHPDWGHSSELLLRMNDEGVALEGADRDYLEALYAAGVRTMDVQLGRLFAELEQRGLLANTIVAVVADHGEEFYDHGRALHPGQFDELIRIPFFLAVPGARGGSTDEVVGLVDLAPTLLELAGLAVPADMMGRSLAPLVLGQPFSDSQDFVWLDNSLFLGLRSRTEAAIFGPDGFGLYDLEADPGQLHNLVGDEAHGARILELVAMLKAEREAWAEKIERLAAIPGTATLDDAERAALAKIGYGE